jgi:hypothetical protein
MENNVMRASALLTATLLTFQVLPVSAQRENIDLAALARIREEGLQRSQAMQTVSWLSDVYGPRLTGSPTMDQAADWAMQQMRGWGLTNVHQERFAFGKGWSLVRFSAHMIEPQIQPIIGMPKSWTSSTNGAVTAEVVLADIRTEADFERYRGRLRGRIVLTQPERAVRMLDDRIVLRMNEQDTREALSLPAPRGGGAGQRGAGQGQRAGGGPSLQQRIQQFWIDEGVVALLDRGSDSDVSAGGSDLSWQTQRTDGGTIFVGSGGARDSTAGRGLPNITLAVEHYNRMVRILEKNVPVRMELDVRTRFHDETQPNGYNIIAEIAGTDPALRDEIVIIGAHFDSHHGATGATDNATGSAAMMEAMRILKTLGLQPRRTIRIALWGAEEQGLLGSNQYVRTHFADRATMELKPDHAKLSAYFNIDNGTGKIRGVWLQQNEAVRPIFEQWTQPLADLGVNLLGPRSVGSTDHASFDAVGLPAFQFIQERYEYNSRTHHSTMDTVDRVQAEDMKQMAVVVATFAYLAAQRDERLPRKAMPGTN